jgi:hypothetical protein
MASRYDASVCSGRWPEAPRCAITTGTARWLRAVRTRAARSLDLWAVLPETGVSAVLVDFAKNSMPGSEPAAHDRPSSRR